MASDIWWQRAVLFSDEVYSSSLLFMQWSRVGHHLQMMCTGAESPLLTASPSSLPPLVTSGDQEQYEVRS